VAGDRFVLLDELRRGRLVVERSLGDAGELAVVAVVEDREELPIAGQAVSQPRPGQRVGEVVGGEARLALLAVGDDRLAGRLESLDRVLRGLILRSLEIIEPILPSS
jgi:hypothetical protein